MLSFAMNRSNLFDVKAAKLMNLPPILLVEDDKNDLLLMRHALRDAEVQNSLLVAENGEVAIGFLTKQHKSGAPFDGILITDINMPRVDGFQLLQWLQNQPPLKDITKLVMSSSLLEADLARSLHFGAAAYFIKPSSYASLVDLVRQLKKTYFEATEPLPH